MVVEAGGNAFDAALAAAAALTVAYPHQCSIGGDLVAVVRPAGRRPRAVLSIGAAAANVDVAGLRAAGPRMPERGPHPITVPGVIAGWAALADLGARLPLADLLAPARALAGDGVPVSPGLHRAIQTGLDLIRADPGLSALLLDHGGTSAQPTTAVANGGTPVTTLVQPVLAATLATISQDWRSFYSGELAERLVAGLTALGSPLSAEDFRAHQAALETPLTRTVNGITWHAAPAPVQGATFLAVVGSPNPLADALTARAARDALLGDPRVGPTDTPATGTAGPKPTGDTVAVTAIDSEGNAVTLIQSVFYSFGSGLLDPGTGVVFHNRGSSFSLDPAHPARLVPGARPPHTLCPTLAVDDETVVALGCQGGRSQPWILAQVAADVVASPDLNALLTRSRWVIGDEEIDRDVPTLLLEPDTPNATRLAGTATDLGLTVETTPARHDDAGHVQVSRLSKGVLESASDPRADGRATLI